MINISDNLFFELQVNMAEQNLNQRNIQSNSHYKNKIDYRD